MGRFKRAAKKRRKLKLAMIGPSGSGKTMTSLMFALRLRELDAAELGVDLDTLELPLVVDTEHGSASDYADAYPFDHAPMRPPYDPDRLVNALAAAAEDGYGVVVIDSFTHFWAGEGGVREIVDASGSGKFSGWKVGTPKHNRVVNAVLAYPGHVIVCMRARTEYVVTPDGKPQKVGVGADQRPGVEYEFQVMFELDAPPRDGDGVHRLTVGKSRLGALLPVGSSVANPTGQAMDVIYEWLTSGAEDAPEPAGPVAAPTPEPTPAPAPAAPASAGQEPAPAPAPEPAPAGEPDATRSLAWMTKTEGESVADRNRRIAWRVLDRGDARGAVAVDEKVSTDTVRKAVKAAEAEREAEARGDGPQDAGAGTPETPAEPPAPPAGPDVPVEASQAPQAPAEAPSAANPLPSGAPVASTAETLSALKSSVYPKAWTKDTVDGFYAVMVELDALSKPAGGWETLLDARAQEWYGRPLKDTTDEHGRNLVERLTTTKLALAERKAAEDAAREPVGAAS
jgi:hypothetical protein